MFNEWAPYREPAATVKPADKTPLIIEHGVEVMMKVELVAAIAVSLQLVLFQPVPVIVTEVPDQVWPEGTVEGEGGEPLETLRTAVPTV